MNLIKFRQIDRLLRLSHRCIYTTCHVSIKQTTYTKKAQEAQDPNSPVKFSTSDAKKWDSMNTFAPEKGRRVPAAQPFIIVACLSIFLVYFIFIREENELDRKLMRPLEETVPNIKEFTLRKQIEEYERLGLDSRELKHALASEIKRKKN